MQFIALDSISVPTVRTERISSNADKWVPYGEDNLFPQEMSVYAGYSPTHGPILKLKANLIAGDGLMAPESNTKLKAAIERFNGSEESLITLKKWATDYAWFGGFAIQSIWNRSGKALAEFYHMDFSTIRVGEADEFGSRNNFYYSPDWARYRQNAFRPKNLPAFNATNVLSGTGTDAVVGQPRQLYYFAEYTPGKSPYPDPSYIAALPDILFDYEYGLLKANTVRNGMFGGFHMHIIDSDADKPLPGEPENGTTRLKALYNHIQSKYRGTKNAAFLLLTHSETRDGIPVLNPIPAMNNADIFTAWSNDTTQRIISAHQLASPVLAGLAGSGSLGGNGNEISTAQKHFLNSVIRPMQNNLIAAIGTMLKAQDPTLDTKGLSISNSNPVFDLPEWAVDSFTAKQIAYLIKEHFGVHFPDELLEDGTDTQADPAPAVPVQPPAVDAITRQLAG